MSSIDACNARWKVTSPRKHSTGNSTNPNVYNAACDVCPANAKATNPADTDPRNTLARPLVSEIVAARAVWRLKCSVVRMVTAAWGLSRTASGSSTMGTVSSAAHPAARLEFCPGAPVPSRRAQRVHRLQGGRP